MQLKKTLRKITELDEKAQKAARNRLDILTKPPGSLGVLEKIAVRLAGITGECPPPRLKKREVMLFAADHGVVEEGVSAYPQEVTALMVKNFINGGAAINVLSEQAGAEIRPVDIGMVADIDHPRLVCRKVGRGTANMTRKPAMTKAETMEAIGVGLALSEDAADRGVDILITGEMGIGNTTPSSALLAVFTGLAPEKVVGPGTGLGDQGLKRKVDVIRRGIELHNPDPQNPLEVLAALGGFEIAGLVGLILGAASLRIPLLVDGFISGAAAVTATRFAPLASEYMLAGHRSAEPGHTHILDELGTEPLLDLNMRLGEGTGAVLALHVVEAAVRITADMATFEEAGISAE